MSSATLNSTLLGWYSPGAVVSLSCAVWGESVRGFYSPWISGGYDALWYKTAEGTFTADVDLNTGSDSPVTPMCTATPVAIPAPVTAPAPVKAPAPAVPAAPAPVSPTAIIRAQSWSNAHVPYSQSTYYSNQYGLYREDCSGYVSMAWALPLSYTTQSLPSVSHPIAKSSLAPGDILLNNGSNVGLRHATIFAGWANAAQTSYWTYEENPDGAVYHAIPYPYWPGYGTYTPYRKN
jgi:hypothetical protein